MSICEQCGAEFSCAMRDGNDGTPCWCTTLPKLELEQMPANSAASATRSCLCPTCLRAWVNRQTRDSR